MNIFTHDTQGAAASSNISDLWTSSELNCSQRPCCRKSDERAAPTLFPPDLDLIFTANDLQLKCFVFACTCSVLSQQQHFTTTCSKLNKVCALALEHMMEAQFRLGKYPQFILFWTKGVVLIQSSDHVTFVYAWPHYISNDSVKISYIY